MNKYEMKLIAARGAAIEVPTWSVVWAVSTYEAYSTAIDAADEARYLVRMSGLVSESEVSELNFQIDSVMELL